MTEVVANPIVQFKKDLDAVVSREMDMLDDRMKLRMKNAMIVAVTKDPDLLLADRSSVFMSLRMCANHGVIPDGVEATIQTYNTKVKDRNGQERWIKKATYLPMIRGIVNRVMRSGKIDLFYAEVVYEDEDFTIDTSHGDRRPVHQPSYFNRKGEVIGAYSVAKYDNGVIDCEPMPRAEIDKVRAVAKTKNVWDGWFEEKAKVAVMKRHSKRLPLSSEDLDFILNRDETDFDAPRDVTPPEARPNLYQQMLGAEGTEPSNATQTAPFEGLAGFPGSAEWDDGVEAFKAGVTDCPHPEGSQQAADWIGGWTGAKRAAEPE
jgi:recombination protein RecT